MNEKEQKNNSINRNIPIRRTMDSLTPMVKSQQPSIPNQQNANKTSPDAVKENQNEVKEDKTKNENIKPTKPTKSTKVKINLFTKILITILIVALLAEATLVVYLYLFK